MKTITILCLLFYNIIYSQLILTPKYSFEYLHFGSKLQDVKNKFLKSSPVIIDDKTKKMMSSYDEGYIFLRYHDSLLYKNGMISLLFTKNDSLLNIVQFIIALSKDDESIEHEKACTNLWEEMVKRFGEPLTDKSIPFFGKVRKWELEKTAISAIKTESGFKSLTLSYTVKK